MNRNIVINNKHELKEYINKVNSAMEVSCQRLKNSFDSDFDKQFYQMKFTEFGRDPLEDRNLNIMEQLNQHYTYLTSFRAVMYLFEKRPDLAPFVVNLGTQSGYDIHSFDESLIAEVFASADARNNDKLRNDIKKLAGKDAEFRYVFYHSPELCKRQYKYADDFPDVEVVYFDSVS